MSFCKLKPIVFYWHALVTIILGLGHFMVQILPTLQVLAVLVGLMVGINRLWRIVCRWRRKRTTSERDRF